MWIYNFFADKNWELQYIGKWASKNTIYLSDKLMVVFLLRKVGEKKLSHPDHQPLSVNKHCFLTVFHLMWDSSLTFSQQAQSHVGNYMIEEGREKQSEAKKRILTRLFSNFLWTVVFVLTLPAHLLFVNLLFSPLFETHISASSYYTHLKTVISFFFV